MPWRISAVGTMAALGAQVDVLLRDLGGGEEEELVAVVVEVGVREAGSGPPMLKPG